MAAKAGKEVQYAKTINPVQQGSGEAQSPTLGYDKEPLLMIDLLGPVSPSSEDHEFIEETVERVEKASYPESYWPAPERNPHTDHEESYVLPTAPSKAEGVATDSTTSEHNETSEHHVTDSQEMSLEITHEGDLSVLQEDHTPNVHLEHASENESTPYSSHDISVVPEEVSTGTVEEISVLIISPHTEKTNVHPTTPLPPFNNRIPPDDSGEESSNPPLDEDTVTQGLVYLDTSANSELDPTTASG